MHYKTNELYSSIRTPRRVPRHHSPSPASVLSRSEIRRIIIEQLG